MVQRRLRAATAADQPAVRALVEGVLAEFGLPPDPDRTDADLADLERHYFARGGRFWVLDESGAGIVGCCGLYPLGPGVVELRKMYLRADRRGAGHGRRMLETVLAAARADGYRRIELETATVLADAIALYERNGFVRQPKNPHAARCDQQWALELVR